MPSLLDQSGGGLLSGDVLAQLRQRYLPELQNPQFLRQLTGLINAEDPKGAVNFLESLGNRALGRGTSLGGQMTLANQGGFYPSLGTPTDPTPAHLDAVKQFLAGSDVTQGASGNASGTVGFAGGIKYPWQNAPGLPLVTVSPGGDRYRPETPDVPFNTALRAAGVPALGLPAGASGADVNTPDERYAGLPVQAENLAVPGMGGPANVGGSGATEFSSVNRRDAGQGQLPQQQGFGSRLGTTLGDLSDPLLAFAGGTLSGGIGHGLTDMAKISVATNKALLDNEIRSYQYARAQGYPGSFIDFKKQMATLGDKASNSPLFFNTPEGLKVGQLQSSGGVTFPAIPQGYTVAPRQQYLDVGGGFQAVPSYGPGTGTGVPAGQPGSQPSTAVTPAPPGTVPAPTTPGPKGAGQLPPISPPTPVPGAPPIPKNIGGVEEQKGTGKYLSENYADVQKAAAAGVNQRQTFSLMRNLAPQTYSGAAGPHIQYARSWLSSFGVDAGKVPAGEVFTSLANSAVLDATGGSLGNQISNSDRDFISSRFPTLATSAEGKMLMVNYLDKLAERKIQVGRLADYYKSNNNDSMKGFQTWISNWAEQNPVFGGQSGGSGGGNIPAPPEGFKVR